MTRGLEVLLNVHKQSLFEMTGDGYILGGECGTRIDIANP